MLGSRPYTLPPAGCRPALVLRRRAALGLAATGVLAPWPLPAEARPHAHDEAAAAALRLVLEVNIVPFWRRVCDQPGIEGLPVPVDDGGQPLGTARPIVAQARATFFFSHLARSRCGRGRDLEIARRGFAFLRQRMWDPDYGGFYWTVDGVTFAATKPDKYINGHAHALLAACEFARASRRPDDAAFARLVFRTIHQRFWDPDAHDYREFLHRDWSAPAPDELSYAGNTPDVHVWGGRFRLLEALTAYHALEGSDESRARLERMIALAQGALERSPAYYFRATDPPPAAPRVTYATSMQTIHELRRARALLGQRQPGLYSAVIDDTLRYGEDRAAGGLYLEGDPGQPADNRAKAGWVQAECLLGTCDSWVRTGNPRHGAAFRRTLRWILGHQVDWARGDWISSVPLDPLTTKDSPFHTGRSVLYCLELLD